MVRRQSWLRALPLLEAIACAPLAKAPPPQAASATISASTPPLTREERARAIAATTIESYDKLGLSLKGKDLKIEVKGRGEFVEGIATEARYFELPGLYDALSATARLFGADVGRSPGELRILAPLALGEVTLAFYDFDRQALVLRDDPDANAMSLDDVVAHELGHAYQDLELGGLKNYIKRHSASPDALRAAHAVLEGQATVFTEALRLQQRGLTVGFLDPDVSDPSVGRLSSGEGYSLIYESGRRFLLARYGKAGIVALIDAFKHPPTSTEQLLHPEKYEQDLPRDLELPPVPASLRTSDVLFDGTLGEMLLYTRLLQLDKDIYRARLAATGWDADHLRVLKLANGSYALIWRLLWDRPLDATQFCTFVAPQLRSNPLVRLDCHDNVTDVTYAETAQNAELIGTSFAQFRRSFSASTEDAASTAEAEAAYERIERQRPRVHQRVWLWPALGVSFKVPAGFFPITVQGVDVLASMPEQGFANNISVTFEQDLYRGDLDAYVREQERLMRSTSQIWKSNRASTIAGRKTHFIHTLVAGKGTTANAFLLLVARDNGTVLAITVATRQGEESLGRKIIDSIAESLAFGQPAQP